MPMTQGKITSCVLQLNDSKANTDANLALKQMVTESPPCLTNTTLLCKQHSEFIVWVRNKGKMLQLSLLKTQDLLQGTQRQTGKAGDGVLPVPALCLFPLLFWGISWRPAALLHSLCHCKSAGDTVKHSHCKGRAHLHKPRSRQHSQLLAEGNFSKAHEVETHCLQGSNWISWVLSVVTLLSAAQDTVISPALFSPYEYSCHCQEDSTRRISNPNHHLSFKFQYHISQDEQSTNKGMVLLCRMVLSGHKKRVTASLRQQHCSI